MTQRVACLASGLAAALLLSGCFGQTQGTEDQADKKTAIVADGCADVIVLGARGSTQNVDLNRGVGTEVRVSAEDLATRLHERTGGTTRIVAVRYDASASATQDGYVQRVVAGAALLAKQLDTLGRTCPDSRFALIGFSQGAQVVHAAALDLSDAAAARIGVVAMMADPRRNAEDPIVQWAYRGPAAPGSGRLGAGTPIPENLRNVAISLCVADDEICNAKGNPGDAPSKTHRTFYEQKSSARQTAQQLDLILASH